MKSVGLLLLLLLASSSRILGAPLSPEQKREVFLLLGMNTEYLGHEIGRPSHFFCEQRPMESIYMRHANALRAAVGLRRIEEVWTLVDSFYRSTSVDSVSGRKVGEATWEMFEGNRDFIEDYIRGAILSSWDPEKEAFRFANAASKAHLIVDLLAVLTKGPEGVEVHLAVFPDIPHVYEVSVRGSKLFEGLVSATLRNAD